MLQLEREQVPEELLAEPEVPEPCPPSASPQGWHADTRHHRGSPYSQRNRAKLAFAPLDRVMSEARKPSDGRAGQPLLPYAQDAAAGDGCTTGASNPTTAGLTVGDPDPNLQPAFYSPDVKNRFLYRPCDEDHLLEAADAQNVREGLESDLQRLRQSNETAAVIRRATQPLQHVTASFQQHSSGASTPVQMGPAVPAPPMNFFADRELLHTGELLHTAATDGGPPTADFETPAPVGRRVRLGEDSGWADADGSRECSDESRAEQLKRGFECVRYSPQHQTRHAPALVPPLQLPGRAAHASPCRT